MTSGSMVVVDGGLHSSDVPEVEGPSEVDDGGTKGFLNWSSVVVTSQWSFEAELCSDWLAGVSPAFLFKKVEITNMSFDMNCTEIKQQFIDIYCLNSPSFIQLNI